MGTASLFRLELCLIQLIYRYETKQDEVTEGEIKSLAVAFTFLPRRTGVTRMSKSFRISNLDDEGVCVVWRQIKPGVGAQSVLLAGLRWDGLGDANAAIISYHAVLKRSTETGAIRRHNTRGDRVRSVHLIGFV